MAQRSATDVRASLVAALRADLVGPVYAPGAGAPVERLPIAPSRWYLTGFLAPKADRETRDPTAEEELATESDQDDEETGPMQEPEPKQKNAFPASMSRWIR